MLIYTTNKNVSSTQKNVLSTKTSVIESLHLITKTLSESRISALTTKYASFDDINLKSEDIEAHYVTLIKQLIRNGQPNIFRMFYNTTKTDFPIIKSLLKYSHHPDVMIRNAARISLMNIFQKCQDQAMEYIIGVSISNHVSDIIKHIKKVAFDMQDFYAKSNAIAMKNALQCYQEELEYIDDILKYNLHKKDEIISTLLNDFIVPYIFTAIIDEQEHLSPISQKIGLCLFSELLESVTDYNIKRYIMRIFLLKETMFINMNLKNQQANKSLLLVLQKQKTNFNTILVLNIFHQLQTYILKTNIISLGEFFRNILFTLMKLLKINYQSKPCIECLKLQLLISIFEPLLQKNTACHGSCKKMKHLFSQNLKNSYKEMGAKIKQKITDTHIIDIIDEEYELFTSVKISTRRIFNDLNYFFEDHSGLNNITEETKIELYYLFCLRYLHLEIKEEKEKYLPIMKKKEQIGKIVPIGNSLPCEKFIKDNLYSNEHFLKITDRQLLILQNAENKTDGIIIFNSYYKDIIFSIDRNNVLKICEMVKCTSSQLANLIKPFLIHIKFTNAVDLQFTIDIINKAKESQIKTIMRKLNEVLCIQNDFNY